jgi:hypothetical protein
MANITASMAEALSLADAAGLPTDPLMDLVGGHAMNSPLLQLCAAKMRAGAHTPPLFMLKHMAKDATLAQELAQDVSLGVNRVGRATREQYEEAVRGGFGDENWTAVHSAITKKQAAAAAAAAAAAVAAAAAAPAPWTAAKSPEEYARLYKPTCPEHVFENHFEAFGAQDLQKIMLDYTDESVIDVRFAAAAAVQTNACAVVYENSSLLACLNSQLLFIYFNIFLTITRVPLVDTWAHPHLGLELVVPGAQPEEGPHGDFADVRGLLGGHGPGRLGQDGSAGQAHAPVERRRLVDWVPRVERPGQQDPKGHGHLRLRRRLQDRRPDLRRPGR